MKNPLDIPCTHIERHGFFCGAEPGDACSAIDTRGNWSGLVGFHRERIKPYMVASKTLNDMTPAERRVIALLANGHNRESVASQMGNSVNTVQKHFSNISAKLGVNSSLEIVCWFYQTYWDPRRID